MLRTKKPEKSLSTLIHDLDGVFSRFIRTRDIVDGKVICFTCGRKMTFQESQCGHFIDRDQMPTRYDERNCHAVCEECNCYDEWHKAKYSHQMIAVYGPEEVERLYQKSKGLQKFARYELEDLIEHYKSVNLLKKQS